MGMPDLYWACPFLTFKMVQRKKSISIPGLSFSWKRALGITNAKQKFARETYFRQSTLASCNHFYGFGKWFLSRSTRNICRLYCFGNMVCPLSCFISYNSLVGYTYFNRNHNFCWRMDIKCYGKILGNRPTCGCY